MSMDRDCREVLVQIRETQQRMLDLMACMVEHLNGQECGAEMMRLLDAFHGDGNVVELPSRRRDRGQDDG